MDFIYLTVGLLIGSLIAMIQVRRRNEKKQERFVELQADFNNWLDKEIENKSAWLKNDLP